MFTLKKTTKNGVCRANRCTTMTGEPLCPRHHTEWIAAGSPDLNALAAAPPKAASSGDALAMPLSDERQTALVTERATLAQVLERAQVLPLETDEQLAAAQTHANTAHALHKALVEERDSVRKPLKDVIKKIDSWFKPNLDTLEAIKTTLSSRIGAALAERRVRAAAALQEIQANAGAAPAEAFVAAHAITTAPAASGGVYEVVHVEVVDFAALPMEYKVLVANTPALRAAVDAGARDIPGTKITVETRTRVGAAA